jgi:hypothetical protein
MTVKRFGIVLQQPRKRRKPSLKKHLEKYLNSKLNAGGLYGLTIDDPGFVRGLIRVIKQHTNELYKRRYYTIGQSRNV